PGVPGCGSTGPPSGPARPPPSRSLGTSLALDPIGNVCRGLVRGGNAGPPMKGQLPVGRPLGVPVALHFSWFVIAALILLSLVQRFHEAHADWTPPLVWGTAAVTAALFFVALVLHELSHAVVARAHGLPVHSITLFALGGVARIDREASDARTEFWMGIAGPVASAVLGALCLTLAWAFGWRPPEEAASPLLSVLVWLGYING